MIEPAKTEIMSFVSYLFVHVRNNYIFIRNKICLHALKKAPILSMFDKLKKQNIHKYI